MNPKYENDTRRRLAEITDAGRFEELATAVLREADERCRRMAHVRCQCRRKDDQESPWMQSCTFPLPVSGI